MPRRPTRTPHFGPTQIEPLVDAIHWKPHNSVFDHEGHARTFVIAALINAKPEEIADMLAFMVWANVHREKSDHITDNWIATQLIHDLAGIKNLESYFVPRTDGYRNLV